MERSSPSIADDTVVGVIALDLAQIKCEVITKGRECGERGLIHSHKWLSEIQYALRKTKADRSGASLVVVDLPEWDEESEVYCLAKSYFDLKEYDRCAYFTKNSTSPRNVFLHFYSRYLSGEKKKLNTMEDCIKTSDQANLTYLKDLRAELCKLHQKKTLDGYGLYIYGVVLKRLALDTESISVLLEALHREPCHWGAWQELAQFLTDRAALQDLDLPDHWMKHFFLAHAYLELQQNEKALEIYFGLQAGGMQESTYILAEVAIAFHNMREVDQAVQYFRQLSEMDPYRLDNLDAYSNLLYVKEQRVELAHLAHKTVEIDKYRTETCCVVGNYYSLRNEHEKALRYFQRALRLNPDYLAGWTLMGHEFMELKNTNSAIECYRRAISVNSRDYRAWYGLGQTYELLRMNYYSLYYYKRAQELRPNDSRMLVALGECYEKLNKPQEALKCYWKAHCVGDIEGGIALFQLAKMYECINDADQAASAYIQYLVDTEEQGIVERDQQSQAFKFMANYYLKKDRLEEAYDFAQKCMEYQDAKTDGKDVLREIIRRRRRDTPKTENNGMTPQEGIQPRVLNDSPASSPVFDQSGMDLDLSGPSMSP